MKLSHVHIANFRAIRTADIEIRDEIALVGQNSAGKTSVLRALNAFFNFEDERPAFESGQHSFQKSSFAVIEVTLQEVPPSCPLARSSGSAEVRARLRFRKQPQWQIHDGHAWIAAPEDLHTLLAEHISYAFIPLRRDHEVAGWGPEGLMERVVEAAVQSTRQRDHITPGIQRLVTRLETQSLNTLATELRKRTPLRGSFEYTLGYDVSPDYSVLLRNLVLHVREGNQTVRLSDSGSGTQSLAVFALYSYLAEAENSTYILGFEEPEQNLHPQAQLQLLAQLKKLGLQVIFTTHSPTMLDALDHEQVVLCRRVKSATRDIEVELNQLPGDFFNARGLNRDDYYKFHRRRNSEFFFSNFVVVTESPIDSAVIEQMMLDAGVRISETDISMLSLDGVPNLSYVFHLLEALAIESAYIVDKDYFLPYSNEALDLSRDARGYPVYAAPLKTQTVISWLLPRVADRARLERALLTDHKAAREILEPLGFYCFRWFIEADLVAAANIRSILYSQLSIPIADQTEQALLVDRNRVIKKQKTLVQAIEGIDRRSLPRTFAAIRHLLLVESSRS